MRNSSPPPPPPHNVCQQLGKFTINHDTKVVPSFQSELYLLRIGTWSWSALNTALLHSAATRAKAFHVSDVYNKQFIY